MGRVQQSQQDAHVQYRVQQRAGEPYHSTSTNKDNVHDHISSTTSSATIAVLSAVHIAALHAQQHDLADQLHANHTETAGCEPYETPLCRHNHNRVHYSM